ncbi:MAG: hypothetical protein WCI11_16290 [Candidatus Methylumidiphilus sp.]
MTVKWKPTKDPLLRGDCKEGVRPPVPNADDSVVRHILYLEGPGRETPYLSATESREVAEYFAGPSGIVWQTMVSKLKERGITHLNKADLLTMLKGNGKGKAKWDSPYEVMQARRYVEQWSEHLLDFREIEDATTAVSQVFAAQHKK